MFEPSHGGDRFAALLADLGSLCWRRPWTIIAFWLIAVAAGGLTAPRLAERLLSGSGDIEGSMSLRVDQAMRTEFPAGEAQALIVTYRSHSLENTAGATEALRSALEQRLEALSVVKTVSSEEDLSDSRLTPSPGSGHFLNIVLETDNALGTEQQVPLLRDALNPLLTSERSRHPDLQWALTGRAALTYDINRFNAEDSARSELRALPITLVVLVLAFGSLVSAMLPLLMAIATRTIALGMVFALAGPFEVSNLVQGIVTMLAIALGIDYSLFLIHRYRMSKEPDPELAMREAMAQSGSALIYSAATVAIGMVGLLLTPLMQTRSIGLGGLCAVFVSLVVALTLVPAFLSLIGSRALNWPSAVSTRLSGDRTRRLWARWARWVIKRPAAAIALSLTLLLAMAAPGLHTKFGFPEGDFLPSSLEYSRGMEMLSAMGLKGLVAPQIVMISDKAGKPVVTPERVPALQAYVARIEGDSMVRAVLGPDFVAGSRSLPFPVPSNTANISTDESRLLLRIIPADHATLASLRDFGDELHRDFQIEELQVETGGQAQYYSDFDDAVGKAYPRTILLVLGLSAIALLALFRAPLVSAKALLLNLLSVGAGFGIVVLVFQLGHGAFLFGVDAPTTVIPITVPLVIFCILFGLSMDYEIFLLARVRTVYMATGNQQRSIVEGLADTGSVITSAALIMVVVFGAFAFARVVIVQMLGLGLAVAVLVDAVVIRSVLGPALMQVAGRWNWWPMKIRACSPVFGQK